MILVSIDACPRFAWVLTQRWIVRVRKSCRETQDGAGDSLTPCVQTFVPAPRCDSALSVSSGHPTSTAAACGYRSRLESDLLNFCPWSTILSHSLTLTVEATTCLNINSC